MAKRLEPEDILEVLADVWSEGYVFLPRIPGDCPDSTTRKRSYEEGPAFYWPTDRDKIIAYMRRHWDWDVYWCPTTFERPRRLEKYASPESWLWADLDDANPREIEEHLRPSIAWESSPSLEGESPHWQALWRLDHEVLGASWAGAENHKLTAYIDGADPSGWDTTQLLRLPGWPNHKPERRQSNSGSPPVGRLLWNRDVSYDPGVFRDLPEVEGASILSDVMDAELEHIDRHEVWARVRMSLTADVRQLLNARDTGGADRSEVLWRLERDLADAGLSPLEIAAIMRGTVWNKYAGRNDEIRRLVIEAVKAVDQRNEGLESLELLEVDEPVLPSVAFADVRRPRWLVERIWQQGSCGFISGPPKHYKSYVGFDLAFSIASGEPFLGQYRVEKPGTVIYIQEEDPLPILRQRYDEIIAGKDRRLHYDGYVAIDGDEIKWHPPTQIVPIYLYVGKGFKSSDPRWQSWLDERIDQHDAAAVIIDTLGTTSGDVDIDRYSEVNDKILGPLKQIAHRQDCALMLIHHNNKASTELGGRAMLGSVGFHGWVEEALYFGGKTKDSIRVLRESKLDRDLQITVTIPYITRDDGWRPQVSETDEDDDPTPDATRSSKRPQSTPRIVRVLEKSGGELSVDEIMDMGSLTKAQAMRQLRRAEDQGFVERNVKGRWALVDA